MEKAVRLMLEIGDRKGAHGCAICLAFIYRAQGKQ